MTEFRFPSASDRTFVCGRTGSGKTRFANFVYAKSNAKNFRVRPHVIIDFKGDDLIKQISRAEKITFKTKVKHPGLYVLSPRPDEVRQVEAWLWTVHQAGNVSLYIDEGYMIPKDSGAFNAILTQGRSLKIPVMVLTQRPTWCSRFIVSEASFYAIFKLQDQRDIDTVAAFTPKNAVFDFSVPTPPFTCRWFDVSQDYSTLVSPVPGDDAILDLYDDALRPRIRSI